MSKNNKDPFRKMLRELATNAPDSVGVWRAAKTPAEKAIAKRVIIANGRKKAALRDEVAAFIRHLTLANLQRVHEHVFNLHTGQVMLGLVAKRTPTPTRRRASSKRRKG